MKNFWSSFAKASEDKSKFKKPIFVLAPMAGVADSAFRQICKSFGADVVYSEMVSATAIVYNSKKTFELLKFDKAERPFVVQLFGSKPEHFKKAVQIVENKIKPDGLDINFGCPVKKVIKQGAGAILMNDLKLARAIIQAVISNTKLPVSIKIRAGAGQVDAVKFLKSVKDFDIKAVMIHGRTLAQGNSGEVNWKIIKQARPYVKGVLLANGGVGTLTPGPSRLTPGPSPRQERGVIDYAEWLLEKTGADGLGIGQGALGRPWIFKQLSEPLINTESAEYTDKKFIFKVVLRHAELAEKLKGEAGIVEMRKHLCWYVSGMKNAGELRRELAKVESLADVKRVLKLF